MKPFSHLTNILFITALPLSLPSHAVVGTIADTTIVRTIVTGNKDFGGCAAVLNTNINKSIPATNCPSNIVTFSCDATTTFTSKDMAFHLFDQAEFAKATGKHVAVYVDDTKKHNTYCYANRIEVK